MIKNKINIYLKFNILKYIVMFIKNLIYIMSLEEIADNSRPNKNRYDDIVFTIDKSNV
jgi:hypothetical protein